MSACGSCCEAYELWESPDREVRSDRVDQIWSACPEAARMVKDVWRAVDRAKTSRARGSWEPIDALAAIARVVKNYHSGPDLRERVGEVARNALEEWMTASGRHESEAKKRLLVAIENVSDANRQELTKSGAHGR